METAHLVTPAQRGDEEAKSRLRKLAAQLVYARVFRSVKARCEAEDVAQDALLAALTALPRLRNPQAFLPWLRRITDNVVADYVRRRRRSPQRSHGQPDDVLLPIEPHDPPEKAEERERVRAALEALAPKNRLAVELFYFDGLTCREVADFLRISHDAARAAISRSRKELRRRMMTMTSASRSGYRFWFMVVHGGATFDGPLFGHDSDTGRLYMALYPVGEGAAAASVGLSPERTQRELSLLQEMRLIIPQGEEWRCTMPLASDTDRELVRVWAESIAEIVIGRLDSLYQEVAALSELVEGDLAKSTVVTVGLMEATKRPFGSLREQMKVSDPDRGRFGKFRVFVFAGHAEDYAGFLGGISCGHPGIPAGECYTYYFHPKNTERPGVEGLRTLIPTAEVPPVGHTILEKLAPVSRQGITQEAKARIADELAVPKDKQKEFWERLADLHAVSELEGATRVAVPSLPLAPWEEYLALLDGIGQEINETVADAADDLRRRTARCSFADCNFADCVLVFVTYLESLVQHAVSERKWTSFPAEADFSWGALIVA